jgi:putative membrane protein
MRKEDKLPVSFLVMVIIILLTSLIFAHDKLNWILETFPILFGLPVLLYTYNKFKLTNLVYGLLVFHSLILAIGSIYTYAKVPLGFWMQDWFGFSRNHYDRIGHFFQGFIPAILTREILLRNSPLKKGKWLTFIIISICLAISAFYELIEFAYAVAIGASAEAFLGTQGDVWDPQWDMTFALTGAILALLFLSKFHNKLLSKMGIKGGF